MFRKNCQYKVKSIKKDDEGRLCVIEVQIDDTDITLCNVYGTNKDDVQFFTQVEKVLLECNENKIILGDFNTVIDPSIDRYGSKINNKNVCEKIKSMMSELRLTDVWRDRNENKMEFSWTRRGAKDGRLQASRIDYALVSKGVDNWVENPMYVSAFHTDLRAFHLCY